MYKANDTSIASLLEIHSARAETICDWVDWEYESIVEGKYSDPYISARIFIENILKDHKIKKKNEASFVCFLVGSLFGKLEVLTKHALLPEKRVVH